MLLIKAVATVLIFMYYSHPSVHINIHQHSCVNAYCLHFNKDCINVLTVCHKVCCHDNFLNAKSDE